MRRVAVFIDWQNCYHCARTAFHQESEPSRHGNVRPGAFAQMLAQKQSASDQLVHVGVYRGEPNPRKDPRTHAAHMRQRQAWIDECGPDVLRVRSRPLRYPPARPLADAEEKGIDVQLAIDAMVMGINREYDLAILATTDTDGPVAGCRRSDRSPRVGREAGRGSHRLGGTPLCQKLEANVPILWIGRHDYEVVRNVDDFNLTTAERRTPPR